MHGCPIYFYFKIRTPPRSPPELLNGVERRIKRLQNQPIPPLHRPGTVKLN